MPKRNKTSRVSNRFDPKIKSGLKKRVKGRNASTNPDRKVEAGNTFYRTKATIKRLQMYTEKPDL